MNQAVNDFNSMNNNLSVDYVDGCDQVPIQF